MKTDNTQKILIVAGILLILITVFSSAGIGNTIRNVVDEVTKQKPVVLCEINVEEGSIFAGRGTELTIVGHPTCTHLENKVCPQVFSFVDLFDFSLKGVAQFKTSNAEYEQKIDIFAGQSQTITQEICTNDNEVFVRVFAEDGSLDDSRAIPIK